MPYLVTKRRPAVLSNVPIKFLARWTYMDRYGRGVRPITEISRFDSSRQSPENETAFNIWLQSSECDAIVYVDFSPESIWYVPVPGSAGLGQVRTLCLQQQQLRLAARIESVPGVVVSVFQK